MDWIAVLPGVVAAGGAWWWVLHHVHPELVSRRELELLQEMLRSQHAAVLREIENLRESLDGGRRGR